MRSLVEKHLPRPTPLQPGIDLIHHIMACVIGPIHTGLRHTTRQDPLLQERRLFDGVDVQPGADMPRDMTMERPHTRIISHIL